MKIAIIGAGIAGAYVANRLSQLNHEITIFEKNNRAGGFCFNYVDENNENYPMSALFILKKYADKRNIIKKLAKQYKITLLKNKNAFYKPNDYKLTFLRLLYIQSGFIFYSIMYYFFHYIKDFGFVNIETLKKRGMNEFLKILCYEKMSLIGIMDDNYDIRNNLNNLSPIVLMEIFLNLLFYSKTVSFLGEAGFMQIIDGLLTNINVQYDINLQSIHRTKKNVNIRYIKDDQSREETFDKIIIATYPHSIFSIMNLHENEKILLSDTVNMIEGGCTVLCDISWDKKPHIFIKQSHMPGIIFNYYAQVKKYSLLGILFENGIYNEELIAEIIKQNNGKLNKIIHIKYFSGYRLFYRNYDITKKLNDSFQGEFHTYYVGSIPTASGLTNSILNHCDFILKKLLKETKRK